ncbi:MAG: hypothetical protein D6798_08595 [Deltaproteobacteria bacterium]|nr:MAG: hypothetical protein D6798_08595 [Deltaproteobacteria bacterium]
MPVALFIVAAVFLAALVPSAAAATIGVALRAQDQPALEPTDVAGLVPAAGWNDVALPGWELDARQARFTATLRDDAGAPAATLSSTLRSAGVYADRQAPPPTSPDQVLMRSWLSFDISGDFVSPDDTGGLVIDGLRDDFVSVGYDLLVYVDGPTTDRAQDVILTLDDGRRLRGRAWDHGRFDGRFVVASDRLAPSNVVAFRDLHSRTVTLQVDAETQRGAINGLQLVRVDHPQPPLIRRFTVADRDLRPGEATSLSWDVRGAGRITIEGEGRTRKSRQASGSLELVPTASGTWTLTARGDHGTATASVEIRVGPDRPNVVVFLVDDMGFADTSEPFWLDEDGTELRTDLNDRYRTPSLEAFADQGVKFTDTYAMPVCSPARASLLTGQISARHHITLWTPPSLNQAPDDIRKDQHALPPRWRWEGLDEHDVVLPRLLQQAGYTTIHVGKGHLGPQGTFGARPENLGFDVNIAGSGIGMPGSYYASAGFGRDLFHVPGLDRWHGTDAYLTDVLTDATADALRAAVDEGAPFFLYMSEYAVHSPRDADPKYLSHYADLPAEEAAFATQVEGMDANFGRILALLEELGVARDTLVFFLSDNGSDSPLPNWNKRPRVSNCAPLRGKKSMRYEGGTRVPMVIGWAHPDDRAPFQQALPIPPGSVVRDIVGIHDLFPTILGVAGVQGVDSPDGVDLAPYLRGEPGHHRPQEMVMHFPHWRRNPAWSWLRQGDWKLIYDYEHDRWELFDLASDISESRNLAADRPDLVHRLGTRMVELLDEAGAQYPVDADSGQPLRPVLPDGGPS